ncbi:LysR family substrate-binding domain-containing protein [Nocardia terpenica]|uniref:Transcriptional regulator n=1 Tax=Nocardia terpenica TaxID=455432 RepID=A0A161WNE5_9NOCA|nr:LysR family substrate-binding domain-containing protein [Nocardia terpenica]KZM74645.1 transcriptional regulator [Nocardia terpenica]NQE93758.1 LysR family substrate-binding domain-containing protein [Nocardia terpenica]
MTECALGALRVGYVPGVTVSKWARIWGERFPESPLELVAVPQAEQEAALREARVDMCFVRLPIDREGLHAIPLWHELPVVVIPKDHPISLFDEVSRADLADERMQDATDIDAMATTVELVAAVGGAAIMPHSLARLHHRRDLTYRTVTDAPDTRIALAWPIATESPAIEEFIGIVRGRTAHSSRGATEQKKRDTTAERKKTPDPHKKPSRQKTNPTRKTSNPRQRNTSRRRGR